MARPIASYVVAIGLDGRISSQGSVTDVLLDSRLHGASIKEEEQILSKLDSETDNLSLAKENKNHGKLIVAEEVEEGHVSWVSCKPDKSFQKLQNYTTDGCQ
jgi:hypothetical protein